MKIYQVTFRRDGNEHGGYKYFSSKREAEKVQRAANKKAGKDPLDLDHYITEADDVNVIEAEISATGIIDLLNRVANHPDNG